MASAAMGALPSSWKLSAASPTATVRRSRTSSLLIGHLSALSIAGSSHRALPPLPRTLPLPQLQPSPFSRKKWNLSAAPASLQPVVAFEPNFEPEPVESQLAAIEMARGEQVFAVVMIGSLQYIVFPGRFIYTQRLNDANINDKIILNKVLMVGSRTKSYIGKPIVTNAAVHAVVEEQGLGREQIVFKFKRKKHYKRCLSHRQPRTRIRILGIVGYEDFPAESLEEVDLD